jgi:hypothetical protein
MELQTKKLCRLIWFACKKIKRKVDDIATTTDASLHHIRKTNDSLKFFEPKTFKHTLYNILI